MVNYIKKCFSKLVVNTFISWMIYDRFIVLSLELLHTKLTEHFGSSNIIAKRNFIALSKDISNEINRFRNNALNQRLKKIVLVTFREKINIIKYIVFVDFGFHVSVIIMHFTIVISSHLVFEIKNHLFYKVNLFI